MTQRRRIEGGRPLLGRHPNLEPLVAFVGGGSSLGFPIKLRQAQGAVGPPEQRAPARLAFRAPGASPGARGRRRLSAADAGPAGVRAGAAERGGEQRRRNVRGQTLEVTHLPRHPPTVDADATLTYHSFFMSRRPNMGRTRFFLRSLLLTTMALPALGGGGCAGSDEEGKPVTYSLTAKQNYEKGLAELKDENYPEAQKYFQFVKQKFPFSKYAVLAELALADTPVRARELQRSDRQLQELRPPAPDAREGRGRLRRLPHRRELREGHAGGRLAVAAVVRKGSIRGGGRRNGSSTTSSRSSRLALHGEGQGAAQRGA